MKEKITWKQEAHIIAHLRKVQYIWNLMTKNIVSINNNNLLPHELKFRKFLKGVALWDLPEAFPLFSLWFISVKIAMMTRYNTDFIY